MLTSHLPRYKYIKSFFIPTNEYFEAQNKSEVLITLVLFVFVILAVMLKTTFTK